MTDVGPPLPPVITLVDDTGIHLTTGEDGVVDVLFDGRRIWSFWTLRDTTSDGVAERPACCGAS